MPVVASLEKQDAPKFYYCQFCAPQFLNIYWLRPCYLAILALDTSMHGLMAGHAQLLRALTQQMQIYSKLYWIHISYYDETRDSSPDRYSCFE